MTVGGLFVLSGFADIFVLDRPANILDFDMTNVLFSFVAEVLDGFGAADRAVVPGAFVDQCAACAVGLATKGGDALGIFVRH